MDWVATFTGIRSHFLYFSTCDWNGEKDICNCNKALRNWRYSRSEIEAFNPPFRCITAIELVNKWKLMLGDDKKVIGKKNAREWIERHAIEFLDYEDEKPWLRNLFIGAIPINDNKFNPFKGVYTLDDVAAVEQFLHFVDTRKMEGVKDGADSPVDTDTKKRKRKDNLHRAIVAAFKRFGGKPRSNCVKNQINLT